MPNYEVNVIIGGKKVQKVYRNTGISTIRKDFPSLKIERVKVRGHSGVFVMIEPYPVPGIPGVTVGSVTSVK